MILQPAFLQFGNNLVALAEWFVASAAIILVVTMVYIFILNKSPPPEGITESKVEMMATTGDPSVVIADAQTALKNGDTTKAVELAVKSCRSSLASLLRATTSDLETMNVSDMAYLVQTKATKAPDITQPIYQLNLMNLKAAQKQPITQQEAEWAVNVANWLQQMIAGQQIAI